MKTNDKIKNGGKLRQWLSDRNITLKRVYVVLGISPQSLTNKLTGVTQWRVDEISIMRTAFGMTDADVMRLFFSK